MAPVLCGISGLSRVIENLFAVTADIIPLLYRHGCKECNWSMSGAILLARRPRFCATVAVNSRPLVFFCFSAVVLAVGGMGGRGCR